MKKWLNKIRKKTDVQTPSRITSDTVAEHRERILAGGRKFKYPIQYVKHRLVFNAIAISVSALAAVVALVWWQLYIVQNTGEFMYRITRFVPVPVANVDGETVLYSDYLMKYRSSVFYLENKEQVSLKTDDGKRQMEYIKQQSMQDAIEDSFAQKLASDMGVSLSQQEVDEFLARQRKSSDGDISEQTYDSVIADYYDWSPSEYRHAIERKLLKQKVSYFIDTKAKDLSDVVLGYIKANKLIDYKKVVDSTNKTSDSKVEYGLSGWVAVDNQDGGLASAAANLSKGQSSGVIQSSLGTGYYIVRLIDLRDSEVNYEYVQVPLTEFTKQLNDIKSQNKISEYIKINKT